MIEATRHILNECPSILDLVQDAGLLDCLLSLAVVAAENDWTRPKVGVEGESEDAIVIQEGRHPLLEVVSGCGVTVVPNSFALGHDKKMLLLTGPNASGKSIYMKQVTDFLHFFISL